MSDQVSIIIPLFNKADYIVETLQSVVAQTHSDFECIVVDNNSTDSSLAKAEEFLTDTRIEIGTYTNSQGPAATRNAGLRCAKGKWVLFLDADDWIEPDHLENLLATARENPTAEIVTSPWIEKNAQLSNEGIQKKPAEFQDSLICSAPWAVHAAILIRESTPVWPEEMDSLLAEDIAFWFAAVRKKKVAISNTATAVYRTKTPNCRSRENDFGNWFKGVNAAIEYNVSKASGISAKECETLVREYQNHYDKAMRCGQMDLTARALSQSKFWLAKRTQFEESMPPNIYIRKIMGIQLHSMIRDWIRRGA